MDFNLKNILTGHGARKEQGIYFLALAILLLTCLGLSQLFFTDGYVWTERFISEEGNHVKNPVGWIFFTIGICTASLLIIPQSLYIYNHLKPQTLFLTRINLLFLILGSMGLFVVGAISEETDLPHNIGSVFAFGGFGLGAFCSFLICFRRLFLKTSWPMILQFIVLFGILFTLGIIVAVGMTTNPVSESQRFQWTGFSIILIYYLGMYLIIPNQKQDLNHP